MDILFVRNNLEFSGGQLKYLDYLKHTQLVPGITAKLYLARQPSSELEAAFCDSGAVLVPAVEPADAYFVAGLDWALLDASGLDVGDRPVVNFVQGVRHADSADPRHAYISRSALRICVSPQVEQALAATGRVNGPMISIPNGLDMEALCVVSDSCPKVPGRVFIGALKRPQVGAEVAAALSNAQIETDTAIDPLPRRAFLEAMAKAEICVLLPMPTEGFFLPAIEAMALGCAVIVPDAVGNRAFCHPEYNCLMPQPDAAALAGAVRRLLADAPLRRRLTAGGRRTAAAHGLEAERRAYVDAVEAYLAGWRL